MLNSDLKKKRKEHQVTQNSDNNCKKCIYLDSNLHTETDIKRRKGAIGALNQILSHQ